MQALVTRIKPYILDARYRLEYLLLRFVIGLVRLLPLDAAVKVSAAAWRMIAPRLRRHKRALENLAIAYPEKTPEEREAIALAMWANLGRVMAETMQLDRILEDTSRIEIRSEAFNRYADKVGPIVGVSLHMGNWELAIWPLASAGKYPAAIYRKVNNPYVDRYLRAQRHALYPGGLFAKGSHEESQRVVRIITDFVKSGGRLGIVSDLHDNAGLPVPFFGTPAKSVIAPALIARRTGARVWMARCLRVNDESRFVIDMKELRIPRTANLSDDIKQATADMQKQFEAWIREAPEQWMWSNRRWS
jgi:Kdo2-lipid IVA lauroyltransferase/acyltransferase